MTLYRLRPFLYSLLILLTFFTLFYFLCLCLGSVSFFLSHQILPYYFYVLKKGLLLFGGRALALFLCKGLGCSMGPTLTRISLLRLVVTTEAGPSLGNFMNPPDLELRIGQPGVPVGDYLSPEERVVYDRLNRNYYLRFPGGETPFSFEYARELVALKRAIVDRMFALDPDGFWMHYRPQIIEKSILTPKGEEYSLGTLRARYEELLQMQVPLNGGDSRFFRRLVKIKKDFLGRFD